MTRGVEGFVLKIIFLSFGLFLGLIVYNRVLDTSNNPALSVVAMATVLAFWIGTLTVVIKK